MNTTESFITALASKDPVPGGGGGSALIGAVSAALCSMVCNLTSGKKKYEAYQEEIEAVLADVSSKIPTFLELIHKDAEVFEPLTRAFRLPKDDPKTEEVMEEALVNACSAPLEIMRRAAELIPNLVFLAEKGTRLALSDVAVAATACRAAIEGAAMNIFINTKLLKDRDKAQEINAEAEALLVRASECDGIYHKIVEELRV